MTATEAISKIRVWGLAGVLSYFRRRLNDRRQARRFRRLAAASRCAVPQRGVTVIGSVTGQVSLDKTLRDFVWNLREVGIPCQVLDTTPRPMIPQKDAAGLVTPDGEFDLRKYDHIVVMYRAPLDPRLVPGCRICRIAFHDSAHGIHDTTPFLRASGDAIIASFLSKAEVDGLTGACDVYLSLYKSEGFGLGMAEAMSQGKPVVATNWSANTEFCRPDTACCIPYAMTPILPHEYPVEMKEWAEADVDAAAAALRSLYDDPVRRRELGRRAQAFVRDHFSLDNFCRSVKAWLG